MHPNLKKKLLGLISFWAMLLMVQSAGAEKVVLKMGTLAPEGQHLDQGHPGYQPGTGAEDRQRGQPAPLSRWCSGR